MRRLLLLLLLLLPGCRLPDEPLREGLPTPPADVVVTDSDSSLTFLLRRSDFDKGQIMLNIDGDASTGYSGGGYDYLVQFQNVTTDTVPVRQISGAGWGAIVGRGKSDNSAHPIKVSVPWSVLGGRKSGVPWLVMIFVDGAQVAYWQGTLIPA
jgi:hypothetical protein